MPTTIKSEYSALGMLKKPNALIPVAYTRACELLPNRRSATLVIVDQGCGKLRNLGAYKHMNCRLVLVDTLAQLEAKHELQGERRTIAEFIECAGRHGSTTVMDAASFEQADLGADIIFSVNVLDVVPPRARMQILRSAFLNLSPTGLYVAILPRHDTWTIRRCKSSPQYADGYALEHHGIHTFYKDWTVPELTKTLARFGLAVVDDVSRDKQIGLVCGKSTAASNRH